MWGTLSSFGLPSARKTLAYWKESRKGSPRLVKDLECVSSKERLRAGLGRSSKEKVKRKELTAVCVYFMGGYREDRAGLSLEVDNNRTKSNGNYLQSGKLQKTFHSWSNLEGGDPTERL